MMILPTSRLVVFTTLFLTHRASAFWILSHSTLTIDRLDPIIEPGKVSSHVHTVIGASAFGPTLSTGSLQESNCTTSPVQDDLSSYWAPQLYHQNTDNGTFTLIPIQYVNTYYKNPDDGSAAAFPSGLRMVAGDPTRTTYNDSDSTNKAIGFVCLDFSGQSSPSTAFPTTNCPNGLRAQVTFPSCWDGKNLDSDDHKSHMSYPIGQIPDAGDCPETHPNKVVTLFHEWIFDVDKFEFSAGKKNWVFSFGDDVGYGFHADFVNGWKQGILEAAVKQCTGQLFNNVEGCPPFVPSIKRDVGSSCKTSSVVNEDVGLMKPLSKLPGCNPIPTNMEATCPGETTPSITGGGGGSGSDNSTSINGTSSTGNNGTSTTNNNGTSTASGHISNTLNTMSGESMSSVSLS